MSSIQDHGVKPVHRYIEHNHPSDPASLVERSFDDESLGVYFDYMTWYYSNGDTHFITGKERGE